MVMLLQTFAVVKIYIACNWFT